MTRVVYRKVGQSNTERRQAIAARAKMLRARRYVADVRPTSQCTTDKLDRVDERGCERLIACAAQPVPRAAWSSLWHVGRPDVRAIEGHTRNLDTTSHGEVVSAQSTVSAHLPSDAPGHAKKVQTEPSTDSCFVICKG